MSTYASPIQGDPNDPNNPYMLRMPPANPYGTPSATSPYGGFSPANTSQASGFTPGGNEAVVDPNAPMENIYAANRDTINTTGNTIGQEAGNQVNYYGGLTTDEQAAQNEALNNLKTTPGYTAAQSAAITGDPNAPVSALSSGLDTAQHGFDPLNTAVNNPNLQVSNQDVNNITTAAGTTVGNQFKTAEDTLRQQAAAQGNTSPAAEAAMRQQLVTQEGETAGDQMTKANIAAKQYQLGALQQQTGLQATAATTEEAAKQAAANTVGAAGINAENTASGRAATEANQAITGASNYRSGLAGQQANAQQGGESGVTEQNTAYGTQTSGGNAAASGQGGFEVSKASLGDSLGKSVANLFGEGGTAEEDMLAKVAEKGPEMVFSRYRSPRRMEDENGKFKVAA